jgi:hypothetical protein
MNSGTKSLIGGCRHVVGRKLGELLGQPVDDLIDGTVLL